MLSSQPPPQRSRPGAGGRPWATLADSAASLASSLKKSPVSRRPLVGVVQGQQDVPCGDRRADARGELETAVEAAVQRSRPVVLTALAAVLAFIPLALDLFWGPLAYVLIGGVAVGTLITLLFVPALYAWLFKVKVSDY